MNFGLATIAVLFVAAIDILLGTVVFFQEPRARINRAYGSFALATAVWGFAVSLYYAANDPSLVIFFARLDYFAGGCIAATFFYFSLVFNNERPLGRLLSALVFIPTILFAPLYFATNVIISGYVTSADGIRNFVYGPAHYTFDIALWIYFFFALIVLVRRYRQNTGQIKLHTLYVIIGTYSVLCIAGITNIILPSFFDNAMFGWIGPTATIVWVFVTGYAVYRHHLFNIRIVATEVAVFSFILAILVRVFFSSSVEETLTNLIFFIATLVFGVYLIRSVILEAQSKQRIENLSNEKSEFMSFASHEIRNPITAMRGFASLMVDGTVEGVSEQGKAVAQKILVNGDTVLALISEFLNKSKLELGQIAYNVVDTDLGKTIASIGEGFKAHAREQGLTLDIKIDYPNLMVKADEAKLREVVGNLIDNSMKYTKQGGVTIEVEKRNGMGRLIVSDTGVGIPPEVIPHLFQKFSRADARKMNLLGTGLGLYLAKTFIEGMGGKIWLESDGPGKGSRFIIELHIA